MPIYGYQCVACGLKKDVLQKLSDAPLTDCPECGAAKFNKQISAPFFRLSGSGWYETDFKTGTKKNLVGDQPDKAQKSSETSNKTNASDKKNKNETASVASSK